MNPHCGDITKSERLQNTFEVLKDMIPHTGKEIGDQTLSTCVHSDISDLRTDLERSMSEFDIPKALYWGRSKNNRKVYAYKLILRQ